MSRHQPAVIPVVVVVVNAILQLGGIFYTLGGIIMVVDNYSYPISGSIGTQVIFLTILCPPPSPSHPTP